MISYGVVIDTYKRCDSVRPDPFNVNALCYMQGGWLCSSFSGQTPSILMHCAICKEVGCVPHSVDRPLQY